MRFTVALHWRISLDFKYSRMVLSQVNLVYYCCYFGLLGDSTLSVPGFGPFVA